MPAFATYNGSLQINNNRLRCKSFEVEWTTDAIDTSSFRNSALTSNLEDWAGGLLAFVVSVQADWKSEDNPFLAPLLINSGSYIANVRFFPEKTALAGSFWAFARLLVTRVNFQQHIRDTIKYDFTAKCVDNANVLHTNVGPGLFDPTVPGSA